MNQKDTNTYRTLRCIDKEYKYRQDREVDDEVNIFKTVKKLLKNLLFRLNKLKSYGSNETESFVNSNFSVSAQSNLIHSFIHSL